MKQPGREVLERLCEEQYDAALAVNAVGQQSWTMDDEFLFDKMGIPFF